MYVDRVQLAQDEFQRVLCEYGNALRITGFLDFAQRPEF
jgi:hypothetical protein